MTAKALYRLPYRHHYTMAVQHEGEPEILSSMDRLNGKEGFVVAPFMPSEECPILLMHPDEVKLMAVRRQGEKPGGEVAPASLPAERESYGDDFRVFHDELQKGKFRKLVLARPAKGVWSGSEEDLFMNLCVEYPRLFVALVSTDRSGTWLMATPEVLLRGNGSDFSTMALAGTQLATPSKTVADYPVEGVEWSAKDRQEQQYVVDYIGETLKKYTGDCTVKGPYTTMAAQLYHLRTDFNFRLADGRRLGSLIDDLFPTPAVCGIPKEEAWRFILSHESHPRKYYSGFVGPISPCGNTQLFVSLRCVHLLPDGICEYYAGGGLLKESEEQKEWEETEAKIATLRNMLK